MTSAEANRDPKGPSPGTDRTLSVLEALAAASSPMTLTSLAARTDISLATCAAIMKTLELRGYAAKRISGRNHFWRPTLKINSLATSLARTLDLEVVARAHLQDLVDSLGMAAHIGVLEDRNVVYVAKVSSPGLVQFNTYPGKTVPFNLTALGMAIAAFSPADNITRLLADVKERHRVADTLERVRLDGYAVETGEEEAGVGCVAAPIFGSNGSVIGSVGVIGFVHQVEDDDLKVNVAALLKTSDALSREFDPGH